MANPATDRLVKAECRFTWNGQLVENVLHFRHAIDSPDPENMGLLAEILDNEITTAWLPLMAATVTYREVYVEEYAGGISQSATFPGAGTGTAGGDSMAGNNTLCLSLRTEFVGRSRRGRFYTIGMVEGHQAAGIVTSTYRIGWLAALNSVRVNTAASSWELVVASFWSAGAPRVTAQVTPVSSIIVVDDFCDSQRRRLQGRGA